MLQPFHVIVPLLPLVIMVVNYVLLILGAILTIARAIIAVHDFIRWYRRWRLRRLLSTNTRRPTSNPIAALLAKVRNLMRQRKYGQRHTGQKEKKPGKNS